MPEGVPIYGKALVELRQLRCMTQDDLSNACEVAGWRVPREMISLYERDKKSPTPQTLAAIAKALELSRVEMRALVRTPTLDAATTNGTADEEADADRRTAGKVIVLGGGVAAFAPLDALERIRESAHHTVDSKLIAAHEDLADTLASLHFTARPDVLLGLVAKQADMATRLLDQSPSTAMRRRVERVAVGLCTQAGSLTFLSGDRVVARRCFALARTVADDSGDDTLRAEALTFGSTLYSPIPSGGCSGDTRLSVAMLQEATNRLGTEMPDFRALAHRWLGQELAAAGHERGFSEAMEIAERLADKPGHGDGRGIAARYAAVLNSDGAARDEGVGYVLLGRAEQAVEALSEVQAEGNPRRKATVLIELAAARVLQDEPEQACEELSQALNLAIASGYAMGVERVRGVRSRFPTIPINWAQLPYVIYLDEQLKVAITSLQPVCNSCCVRWRSRLFG